MKIGDVRTTTRTSRIAGKKAVGGGQATSSPASPVDQIVLMGIPSVELTPKVRSALMTLMAEVQELRAELRGVRSRISDLEELADRDPLLDIFNRRAFVRELDRVLAMIDRYGVRASLIFVDLNDLKKINDGKGHAAGDAALGLVADVITANIRQTDAVGRLGGDEFGVLLLQSDQTQAEKKAQHLSDALAGKIVNWRDGPFGIGISWGAVEIVKGVSAEQAMERADSAMYEAKRNRNSTR
jgi:diguanylate cyclase (GGDEF)-like protein